MQFCSPERFLIYLMTGSKAPLNLRTLWRYINVYYVLTYLQ